ncbi:hypothetical protein HOG17_03765 [Candidatus Peregrinibacteria bacterium]|nr:hypothetical protein [Candidatus Peregrinibacteria bacterium]MBT4148320.1 hypothetical protein [Candidatus Peregrinibacteria bacterium]MBT4366399.1 hypothetical protein [Candidatus Peregrinibacteria bacterium]MBT4455927.1 hypothetical protein [Candidatus Peregrinibacteria bacterium]
MNERIPLNSSPTNPTKNRSLDVKNQIFGTEVSRIEEYRIKEYKIKGEAKEDRGNMSKDVIGSLAVANSVDLVKFNVENLYAINVLDSDREGALIGSEKILDRDTAYRNLIYRISKTQKLDLKVVKELLDNKELQDRFIALVDFTGVEDEGDLEKKYAEMVKAFNLELFKYFDPKNANGIAEIFLNIRRGRRLAKITMMLMNSDEFGEEFFRERKELDAKFLEGSISEEEYLDAMDEMYARYIELSGDEELMALWESVNVDEKIEETFINTIIQTAAVLIATTVISPKEQSSAKSEVESQFNGNYSVEFGRDGLARVQIADFSVDLIVRKDLKTGEFIYFVNDEYINGGENFGPFSAINLPSVIDARRIDAYVTKKVGKMSDSENFSSMRKASDRKIESIGLKLLGEGQGRGFDFGSDDFVVLDNLAASLLQKNDKYTNVGAKIDELSRYLNTQARFDTIRTALLNNKDIWQMM